MSTEVKRRRGSTVEHSTFTGAVAELTVDLTKDTVVVHDGATQGGFPLLREDFDNVPTTAPFTNISLDTAIFDTGYSADGNEAQGTLYWNTDELTLSLVTNGETIELGQKVEVNVKNQTGSQIDKGEVVYASGTVGNSGRILVTKMIADGTIAAKRILGVAAENIADGADGKVIKFGKLRKINTTAFSEGDILWVSTTVAGAFQNTEPVQANGEIALPIAFVVTDSVNNGEIFVRVTPIDENEYQNYDAGLQDIAGLTPTDSNIIVGDGTNWVAESGDTARASLGLGTGDSPTFTDVTLTGVLNTNEINTQSDLVWSTSTEVFSTSDYYIAGSLNIASSVYITDELDVAESLRVGTTLDVGGTLDVTGNTTLGGTANISSNTTIGGTLTLSGSADFNSTMNLQGAMTTQNTIQSDNFDKGTGSTGWLADGATGFAIEDNAGIYDMYVDSLTVRGSLRVFELIAKQISAIGGTEILSVANGVAESVSGSAGSEVVTLEDPTNTLATSFADFDLVLVQRFNPNNPTSLVKQEFRTVSVTSGLTITLTSTSGAPAPSSAIEAGDFIVAYGNTVSGSTRGNIIYRNVEGQPIVRLQTGIDSYADFGTPTTTTRIAYGDLDGFSGQSTGTFGFFAGDNSAEHVLIKGDGLFFKDNSTVLAELTSNTFKVGDGTNFLSFDGTDLDIQTDKFTLETTNLSIDSANELITIGSADSVSLGKKLNLAASSDVDYRDSLNKYSSTVDFYGLYLNPENYFGFVQDDDGNVADGYNFRVGGATSNYIEVNGATGDVSIKFDTFDLEAGGLAIDSSQDKKILIADGTEDIIAIGDFDFAAEVSDTTTASAASSSTTATVTDATPTNSDTNMDTGIGTLNSNVAANSPIVTLLRTYNVTGKWVRVQFDYSAPPFDDSAFNEYAVGFSITYFGEQIQQLNRNASDGSAITGSVDKTIFVPDTATFNTIQVQSLAPSGVLLSGDAHSKINVSNLSVTVYDDTYTYTDIGNDGFRVYNSGGKKKLEFKDGNATATLDTLSIGSWDFELASNGDLLLKYEGSTVQTFTKP